jgi:hypothetical protein
MSDAGVNKKNSYSKGANLSQKTFCGPSDGTCNATDEKFLGFLPEECENGLYFTRETVYMKAWDVATSQKVMLQDFKAHRGWALRLMHHKGSALHWSTLVQKVPNSRLIPSRHTDFSHYP